MKTSLIKALFFGVMFICTEALHTQHLVINDFESVIVHDIEDIHLKTGEENQNSAWFDLDSDGKADLGFWVSHSFFETNSYTDEILDVTLKAMEDFYFAGGFARIYDGPCDSTILAGVYPDVHFYSEQDTIFNHADSISFKQYFAKLTEIRRKIDPLPCYTYYDVPNWIGKEGYVGFKKDFLGAVSFGWFKVEVLDYDEVIIKAYGLEKKDWSYPVAINEIMASNRATLMDEYGEHDDWIEIYNGTPDVINVGDLFLTNNLSEPNKWQMPETEIEPWGFLLIWLDGQTNQGDNHANFTLDKDGDTIALFTNKEKKLDAIFLGEETSDISFGRYPNGSNNWVHFNSPTPGSSNELVDIHDNPLRKILSLYPNPAFGSKVHLSNPSNYSVYNSWGQKIHEAINSKEFNTSKYNKGLYIVVIDSEQQIKLLVQ